MIATFYSPAVKGIKAFKAHQQQVGKSDNLRPLGYTLYNILSVGKIDLEIIFSVASMEMYIMWCCNIFCNHLQ